MPRPVVSQNERLMLHLLEMDGYREEPEVPLGGSQEGIANRLGTQVHNASRALSVLESDGLVMDRLAHIRGAQKRRRAYFLTDKGHKVANEIKGNLLKSRMVYEERGRAEEMTLAEAFKCFNALTGCTPSFLDLVDIARGVDVVRSDELSKRLMPPVRKERYVEAEFGRPKTPILYGRESERTAIMNHVSGGSSVVLIWGIPGIGKTSLASKVFDELSGRKHLFWYSFHSWDTEEHFVSVLSKFLESANRASTAEERGRGAAVGDLFAPLLSDLTGFDAVLFMDDVQKASEKLVLTLAVVLEAVKASGTCKAVLMSRELPSFFSKTGDGNVTVELSGLDNASARKFAENAKAKDPAVAADASLGHPLLLSLMSRSGVGESRGDILSFMDREISMSLTPDERSMLELLSVYRHPVPVEAIVDREVTAFIGLKDKALVIEQESGVWTHDVLREFFISRLGAGSRATLHRRAARYCEGREGADWMLESLHHHIQAGDIVSARRVATAAFEDLSFEFPQETLEYLELINAEPAPVAESVGTLFHMGQLSEMLGDDASAARHYESCLDLLQEAEDSEERAQVLESLGKLKTRVEQWAESFEAHEKALGIYENAGDVGGQTREWLNIGGAHRKRGDFAKARAAYAEALSLASKGEDRGAQSACMNNLALLDWDEGRLKDAETRLKESVRLAHAVKNHAGEARGLENLAELFRIQARLNEMTILLRESSEAFRRAGELEEFKRLQAACSESLAMQGRTDEAIGLARDALSRPELRKRTGLLKRTAQFDSGDVALSITLIGLLRSSGNLKEAEVEVDRLISMAESLDDSVLRSKANVELALLRESSGDLDGASDQLVEAEKLLRAEGDKAGLVAVSLMFGNIEEKRGDYVAARARYVEAIGQAELLGDDAALAAAKRNMESLDGTPR